MSTRKKGMHLHQILLQVRDMAKSKEFYTKTLGFKLQYDFSPGYLAVLTPNKLQIGFYSKKSGKIGNA
ncbi:MAG TPA: VOC family protein, partial [Candidatus Binatus sp.]|nr:VOC family protein [Candidatus Binatus sp.]